MKQNNKPDASAISSGPPRPNARRKHHSAAAGSMIPLGQPILIGHHSERGHRAHLKRIDNAYRKGSEAYDKAKHYRGKADGVGRAGVSSDDPEAVTKLREKLARREKRQADMKACNRIIRANPRNALTDAKLAKLVDLDIPEDAARNLFEPDFCGRIGFPDYALTNNNANIRRIRERIAMLERTADAAPVAETFGGIEYREDDNRVRLIFPGKPPKETRQLLKSHGFRWSPSAGAWQRHLNNAARQIAKYLIEQLQVSR